MTKRIAGLLLALCMCFSCLSFTAMADTTTVNKIVITMSEPTVGEAPPTDAKVPSGVSTTVIGVRWEGTLDSEGKFRFSTRYTVYADVEIKAGKNARFSKKKINATVNGQTASVERVSDTKVVVSLKYSTIKSNLSKEEEKAAKKRQEELDKRLSKAEADAQYPLDKKITLVVNDANYPGVDKWRGNLPLKDDKSFYIVTDSGEKLEYTEFNCLRISFAIIDSKMSDLVNISSLPNIKEIWLGSKCDVYGFFKELGSKASSLTDMVAGNRLQFNLYEKVIYIPDSIDPKKLTLSGCRVKLYSGDVYAAAKAGGSAARDWCVSHTYNTRYATADRRLAIKSCAPSNDVWPEVYYYSCKCGKCEYNKNHTWDMRDVLESADACKPGFDHYGYDACDVSDEHFLGTTSKGDRVYLKSCPICGKDKRQDETNITYEQYVSSMGITDRGSYQRYVADMKNVWSKGGAREKSIISKIEKEQKRLQSDGGIINGCLVIPKANVVTAKVSISAKNDVQEAGFYNLIDKGVLGNDYTVKATRIKLVTVAVKLAEQMTGKSIAPAAANTFIDTDNEYVRRAYTAGITKFMSGNKFYPNGLVTRQEVAVAFYSALQYIKDNSDSEYTVYTPDLSAFKDKGKISSSAITAVEFMNALGLMDSVSSSSWSPKGNITVEEILVTARRCLYADRIGWYQCCKLGATTQGNFNYRGGAFGGSLGQGASGDWKCRYYIGDRVWINGFENYNLSANNSGSWGYAVHPYMQYNVLLCLGDFKSIKDR